MPSPILAAILKPSPATPSIALAVFLIVLSLLFSPLRHIFDPWPFFTKRYDFLKSSFQRTRENVLTFKVLRYTITAVRGEEARKAFFDDKRLDFTEGYEYLMARGVDFTSKYKTLVGGGPKVDKIKETEQVNAFNKLLAGLTRKERMMDVIPTLFDDIQRRMVGWGNKGRMDPFIDIYDLVFQMTVRMASCRSLSNDIAAVTLLRDAFWDLEYSSTATLLLFPWLPSPSRRRKAKATTTLFETLFTYVNQRKVASDPNSDFIDVLLAQGLTVDQVVGLVVSIIFAGVVNTGITACWALVYLGANKEWRQKVTQEVQSLLNRHTYSTAGEPLHKRLSTIPINVWEEETPLLELVIRETLRLAFNGTALRRNLSDGLVFQGHPVDNGDFLVYNLGDAHLNPNIYSDPMAFDPARFAPGREEDKKQTNSFLGWGSGRHACTGMKIAKLEIKFIVALFLACYDYKLVDSSGNYPKRLPTPNLNDVHQARPLGKQCYFAFERARE